MYEVLREFDEESILDLCWFAGKAATFDESYDDIVEGSEIVLWTEKSECSNIEAYRLKLIAIKTGEVAIEGADGTPANIMFQAEVLRSTNERDLSHLGTEDDEISYPYGILLPNGFASIVDNATKR